MGARPKGRSMCPDLRGMLGGLWLTAPPKEGWLEARRGWSVGASHGSEKKESVVIKTET